MGWLRLAAAISAFALTAAAQQTPRIVGGISSTAAIEIDGTEMSPAPSWPLVDRDLVRTASAPGLIQTVDRNSITLMPETTARIRVIAPDQTWIFVRTGALSVDTTNRSVMVCIGNRVFQPSAQSRGTLQLEKSGAVSSTASKGILTELKSNGCGEEMASGMLALPTGAVAGGVAGTVGTAAGGTATATAAGAAAAAGAAGAVTGGAAAAVTAVGVSAGLAAVTGTVTATSSGSCASSGCNFNPAPVTPSAP